MDDERDILQRKRGRERDQMESFRKESFRKNLSERNLSESDLSERIHWKESFRNDPIVKKSFLKGFF
jgi:hypothetical protein